MLTWLTCQVQFVTNMTRGHWQTAPFSDVYLLMRSVIVIAMIVSVRLSCLSLLLSWVVLSLFPLFLLQNGGNGWAAATEGSRGLVRVIGRAGDGGQTQGRPRHSWYVVQAARFLVTRGWQIVLPSLIVSDRLNSF